MRSPSRAGRKTIRVRWIPRRLFFEHGVIVLVVGFVLLGFYLLSQRITEDTILDSEATLRKWQEVQPIGMFALGIGAYFIACFLPGSHGKSIISGWLFGPLAGSIVTNVASTLAAFAQFLAARYLFRDWFQTRFQNTHQRVNDAIQRDGAFYLLGVRLVPALPFTVVNPLMGVSEMKGTTFWWASQLGMFPANFLFAYMGASLPDISTAIDQGPAALLRVEIVIGLAALAAFPFFARYVVRKLRKKSQRGDSA